MTNKDLIRALLFISKLSLGLTFAYAGWSKLHKPQDLAQIIAGYQLVPILAIAPITIILPFVELWSALLVLVGPSHLRRAAALILSLLLIAFILGAAQGLIRGLDFECGCFGSQNHRRPGFTFFLQDSALLLASIIVLALDKPKKKIARPGDLS
ncbi:MAG: DoxX family membrane protein [Deltaproteobacteria bacterium]|jgi:uncharacterized membrane protein YphA (DoxX/SURF4 family)|nr:DoxX family membrane protein [Deltaproteobacteria bacterium]